MADTDPTDPTDATSGPQAAAPPEFLDTGASDPAPPKKGRGAEPVRWVSPSQLLTTAIEVVQGTIFGRFADKREVMGGIPGPFFKLNEGERELDPKDGDD